MKSNSYDDDHLETLLAASYDRLRQPNVDQRQTLLDGLSPQPTELSQPRAGVSQPRAERRSVSRRVGTFSLVTAACILALVGVRLLVPSASGVVYGVEEISRRMCEVQTIRIRGWQHFYNDRHPANPPIRIPVEYMVKRPDKFRSTTYGVSYGDKIDLKTGTAFCDGRQAGGIHDSDKTFQSRAISPLDAALNTESRAQTFIAGRLGSPANDFKKTGEGHCNGRKCDLYEGEFEEPSGTRRTKLWFDPMSGYPLRLTDDELQPDGSFRRQTEWEEILVNVPLADELFREVPGGYKRVGPAPEASDSPPVLSTSPSGSGQAGRNKLEFWEALRIADNAALVVWRRSPPVPAADGTLDWLSNIDWQVPREADGLTVQDAWLFNSESPDVWSWSLVVMTDGRWPDPGYINLRLRTERGQSVMGMHAIWFPDDQLRQMLAAAADVMLPADAQRFSLEAMRAKAAELSTNH